MHHRALKFEWYIENVKDVDFKNNIGILEKMRQFLVK
jgi:hypothetical protein